MHVQHSEYWVVLFVDDSFLVCCVRTYVSLYQSHQQLKTKTKLIVTTIRTLHIIILTQCLVCPVLWCSVQREAEGAERKMKDD